MNAPVEVSGAAHLPQATAARAPLKGEMAVTALRLEGFAASVAARAEHLAAALKGFGRAEQLDGRAQPRLLGPGPRGRGLPEATRGRSGASPSRRRWAGGSARPWPARRSTTGAAAWSGC